jgi:ribosomal protein S11
VTVSKDGTDLTVQMKLSVAPTYDITFNVYSSGASISNAQIYIEEELVAITNSSGNAMIKREAGQYTYRVVADYFEPYSGTITVVTPQQVNVNLIRLTSTVKFVVKDIDTSDFIANAVVLFNNEVQNTNSSGEATFLNVVQGQSLSYVITKLPCIVQERIRK